MARKTKVWSQLSLQAKIKQTTSCYQVLTKLETVYEVTMPTEVARTLSVFEIFSLNIDMLGLPLQCFSLVSFHSKLLFYFLAPLIVEAALLLLHLGKALKAKRRLASGLLDAIPLSITFSFLVLPMVSSIAFRALQPCEQFDDGSRFLKADYRLSCGSKDEPTAAYSEVRRLAWLTLAVYVARQRVERSASRGAATSSSYPPCRQ